MRLRLKFRTTQIIVLLVVFLVTIAGVGITAFLNARFAVQDLSGQVLAQTASRIDQRIQRMLAIALTQSRLNANLLESGRLEAGDLRDVARYFLQALRANPQLSFLSYSLEENGHYCHVKRDARGRLSIRFVRVTGEGQRVGEEHVPAPGGMRRVSAKPTRYDPRERPFYKAARRAKGATWTESYIFVGKGGKAEIPGVTRARPVHGKGGALLGVLTADFDLAALSAFLRPLRIGESGFAFILELREGRPLRTVIAHPDPSVLTRPAKGDAGKGGREAVPAAEIGDARIRAFLRHVPGVLARTGDDCSLRRVRFDLHGTAYLGGFRRLSGQHGLAWLICMIVPEEDVMGRVNRMNRITLILGLVGIVIALILGVVLTRRIARTMNQLATETEAVGQFQLDPKPVLESGVEEVNRLATSIEDMKAGLRSFKKFVPSDLVRMLLSSGEEASLGGEHREITILFSDIAGFTSLAEVLPAEALVAHLSEYLSAMAEEIMAKGGTVDKFIGDAVMAFWGAPHRSENHAGAACLAALRCQARIRELRERWQAEGRPSIRARIGLNTGDAVVGNIGSASRLEYTAIGDPVNLASRLEGLNKVYGTEILISESTYRSVSEHFTVRLLDRVSVKGKHKGSRVYELLGLAEEVPEKEKQRARRHTEAVEHYLVSRFEEAWRLFDEALAEDPGDQATRVLRDRCQQYLASPPPPGWDGVYRVTTK